MGMGNPEIVYKSGDEDRSNSFIKYFAKRVIGNNKNFLCAVTGQTGSGKSWLSGAVGEEYAKMTGMPFNPHVHTIFSLKELLDLINNDTDGKELDYCTFLHFDEPQVAANSRDWQAESNKILNTLTSTFRNRRLVIFFATPYLEFIDKQSRILFHAEINVSGFDKTTGYTLCKPRILEWNAREQVFYKKRLVIKYQEKAKTGLSWYFLQNWEVYRPSKAWIDIYEPKKKAFTEDLNRKLAAMLYKEENPTIKDNKVITADDMARVKVIYAEKGGDYEAMLRELPHLSLNSLEKLTKMIRKLPKVAV